MDAQEATRSFKQAEALYASGRHEEALQILENLDLNFPNTKNILYPKGLCLAALGRKAEAGAVCDSLEALQDPRTQSLREKLGPPAQDDGMDMALDMDLLGDFDKPKPKRTTPVQVRSASKMPIYIGVAVAVLLVGVVGALVSTGTLGKLFPQKETLESALAKIGEAGSALKACSGYITAEGNLTQPMPMKLNLSGDFDFLMEGSAPMYAMNVVATVENLGVNQAIKIVCDGSTMYQEMDMMGQKAVMKMPVPPGGSQKFNPTELLGQIQKIGTITLGEDEMVEGEPAYVFLVKPLDSLEMPAGMPKLTEIKVLVVKSTGMPAVIEVKDESGAVLAKASTSGVIVNSPSSPDKFKYTPPAGAQVMDMADMQKMMPFQMPGM